MLRRDMAIEPTELEITRLARSLLAAGAFAPDAGEYQPKVPVSVDSEPTEAAKSGQFGPRGPQDGGERWWSDTTSCDLTSRRVPPKLR